MEADIFSLRDPADSDLIDGLIGEGSPFHQTFGYYAHGVGPETAVLPSGWRERVVPISNQNTGGGTGLCLEAHDLSVSKLIAGREKDMDFVACLLRHRLVNPEILSERLSLVPMDASRREVCVGRLQRICR